MEPIDGEAPGLDPDHVIGTVRGGRAPIAVRVDDGFMVRVNVPEGIATSENTLNALPTAVSAVARSLG